MIIASSDILPPIAPNNSQISTPRRFVKQRIPPFYLHNFATNIITCCPINKYVSYQKLSNNF